MALRVSLRFGIAAGTVALASAAAPAAAGRLGLWLQVANQAKAAREALADRDYASAARILAELDKAGGASAESVEALFLLGKAKFYSKDYPGALAAWDQLLERYPDSAYASKVRFLMADAWAAERRYKEAAELYRERAEFFIGSAYRARLAGLYLEIADKAFTGVKAGREGDPLDPPRLVRDLGRALAMYRKAREIGVEEKRRAEVAHRIAAALLELGNAQEAAAEWTAFLHDFEATPLAPEAAYGLGIAWTKLGKMREARETFARVEERWGDSKEAPLAVEQLGWTYRPTETTDREQAKKGLAHWARFLERYPQHPVAPTVASNTAQAIFRMGDTGAAVAAYELVIARWPKHELAAEAQYRIGEVYLAAQRYDEARDAWAKFLGAHPSHRRFVEAQRAIVGALFQKAQDLAGAKKWAAAEAAAREFLAQYPLDALSSRAQLLVGETLSARGEHQKARDEYAVCASKYAQSAEAPQAQLRVALVEERELGDLAEAIKQYEQLIQRWPGSQEASVARETIRVMREKALKIVSTRAFASNEPLALRIETRNIPSLEMRAYRIDLLEYFRKKHAVGGVEELAIEVVTPDRTWKDEVPKYEPYRFYARDVPLPLEEKGAYVLSCEEDEIRAVTLVLRSDITIVAKQGPQHLVVFAKDEVTGRPAAGVKVLASNASAMAAEGETGPDGVYAKAFDGSPGALRVFAYRGKEYAFSEAQPASWTTWGYQTKAYIYTDRPVYRPGQKAYYRGILRKVTGGVYQPSNGEPIEVSVRDARGVILSQRKIKTDDYGAFDGEIAIGDEPPLGTYAVVARYAGTDFQGTFEVEAYRKPEFLVDVEPVRRDYLTGEEVKAVARVSYYFGGAVREAKVRWRLFVRSYVFDHDRYRSFAWFFQTKEQRRPGEAEGRFIAQGEAVADKEGKVEIAFETEAGEDDRLYTLEVEALDPSRRSVAGAANIYVTARAFFGVLETDKKVYRPGENVRVTARAVDAGHRGVAVKGELVLFRRRLVDGRAGEDPAKRMPLETGPDGKAETEIKVDAPGDYRLAFVAKDRRGSEVAGGVPLVVAGEAEDLAKEAKLVAERTVYTRGDTANVLLNVPAAPCWALLTFEGEKVLDYRVIELVSRSTTIPVEMKDVYSPNVFIRAAIPVGKKLHEAGDEVAVLKFLKLEVSPDRLKVRPGEKLAWKIEARDHAGKPVDAAVSLAVVDASIYAIRSDTTPPIQPFFYDQKRTLAVSTRSSYEWRYEGVTAMKSAELLAELSRREQETVAGAEKRALDERFREELKSARDAASSAFDLGSRGAPAAEPAPALTGDHLAKKGAVDEKEEGGGGGGLADRARVRNGAKKDGATGATTAVARVRRTFADTAYWNPTVITRGGTATVEMTLPDNLTTWRATVRGATRNTLVGSAEADVVATQKVLVRLETPRFATQGDAFTISTLAHNYTGEPLEISERFTIEGALAPGAPLVARAGAVEPNAVARADHEVRAAAFGGAQLRAEALSTAESDAVEMTFPVGPYGVRERRAASGTLETGEFFWRFEVPPDAVAGTQRLTLRFTPSIATAVLDALAYLDEYPYGCIEQTVNRFLPALAARRAIGRLGIPNERARRALDEAVERGIVRLANLQGADGGWGWWPEGGSRGETTALALAGLEIARESGVFVDPNVLYRGRQAALNLLRRAGDAHDVRAMLLRALALSKSAPEEELGRAVRAAGEMGAGGLGQLALALADQERRDMAGRVLEALRALAQPGDGGAVAFRAAKHGWFSGTAESTAWAVLALLRYEPQSDLVEKGVRHLLGARTGDYWRSTRETGAVVLALGAFLEARAIAEADYRLTVFLDGKEVATTEVRRGTVDEEKRALVLGPKSLPPGAHALTVKKEGPGAASFTVVAEAFRAAAPLGPTGGAAPRSAAGGIEAAGTLVNVARKHVRFIPAVPVADGGDGKTRPVAPGYTVLEPQARPGWREEEALREAASGEKLVCRVAVELRERLDYAIVEDRLPAGFEALSEGASGPFERFEPRDDRVAFFSSALAPGTHVFSYVVRAVTPGEFAALPAECYGMYEPEVHGRSTSDRLAVRDRPIAPREPTPDEIYAEALALLEKRAFEAARPLVEKLLALKVTEAVRERLLSALLDIRLAAKDSRGAVKAFEELADRNPRLSSDRARASAVGLGLARAYAEIGDPERALGFLRALVAGQFRVDVEVADVYRSLGRELPAQDYLAGLVRRYPDADYAIDGWYRVARRYFDLEKPAGSKKSRPRKMYEEAYAALKEFIAFHPESAWCDDAQHHVALALFNLEQYALSALEAEKLARRYPKSEYVDDALFRMTLAAYMEKRYDQALAAGERLLAWREKRSDGRMYESEFVSEVRHIFAKIHHLRGNIARAIEYYSQVEGRFEDARDAVAFFTAKKIETAPVVAGAPGEVRLAYRWRNLSSVSLKIYPVDLFLLFMREKDLSRAADVDLTGVAPRRETEVTLRGEPYAWNETSVPFPIAEKGVYLVVAKAGDHDASSLAILTDLEVKVQRIGDKVRVYAIGRKDGKPVGEAFVTVSDGSRILGRGRTDARGMFEARGAQGPVSVVAEKDGHYALYREDE